MKAYRIPQFGLDRLEIVETETPIPGPNEVLVEVHAVSLNFRDLRVAEGKYDPRMRLPRQPCSDGAGEVVQVGAGVSRFKNGDRVTSIFMQNWIEGPLTAAKSRGALGGDVDGMLATHVALSEEGLIPVPAHLTYAEAATLPCAAVTAWHALVHAAAVKPGDTVLIQGTGGVSIFALQFAKLLGARVLGISSSDEKIERAKALGLDAAVNYRSYPDWARWAIEQTGGEGVDLVVEVGGQGTFNKSLKAVRVGGTVAQIGVLSAGEEQISVLPILHKQISVRGIYVGSRAMFEEMNRAIAQARFRPVVDHVYSFEEVPLALRQMADGSHFGKIVIDTSRAD